MTIRHRGEESFDKLMARDVVFLPTPTITSSLESGTTTARLYSIAVSFGASGMNVGSTGNRRAFSMPYHLATDTAGFFPQIAGFSAATQGSTTVGGGIVPSSSAIVHTGRLVFNSTGHVIAAFTATTAGLTTSYLVVVMPDGSLAVSSAIITT